MSRCHRLSRLVPLMVIVGVAALLTSCTESSSKNATSRDEAIEMQLQQVELETQRLQLQKQILEQQLEAKRDPKQVEPTRTIQFSDLELGTLADVDILSPESLNEIPEPIRKLSGKRVTVKAFMFPTYQEKGINNFALTTQDYVMVFTKKMRIDACIEVNLKPNTTTEYVQRPITVTGTFEIRPTVYSKDSMTLYRLTDAVVER